MGGAASSPAMWLPCALALAMPAAASAQSLADFTASIYPPVVPAYPCTKLLNRSGAIGCENPTQQVLAPLELIGSEAELSARADAPAPRADAPMLVLPYEVFAHDDAFESRLLARASPPRRAPPQVPLRVRAQVRRHKN